MICLGIDTSNYTTSVAFFDGTQGENRGQLLPVPAGALGLRQNEALFAHVKQLPALWDGLYEAIRGERVLAVAASTRPRAVEGSYMPCFLAGEMLGRTVARTLDVPFVPVSHQQGHIAAAAFSAGDLSLLDRPHLSWHLSGGTTELLYVTPDGPCPRAQKIGGTEDLSAGQLIDRTGKLLGVAFPAGRVLDAWSQTAAANDPAAAPFPVKVKERVFSLSGMENKVKSLAGQGAPKEAIARFALDTLAAAVFRATEQALELYPGLPVLFAGGVSASARLRLQLAPLGGQFSAPACATDNALGVAILAHRALGKERGQSNG
jgi:N6-L-threonylcarbamoyladenine synthase